MKRKRIGEYLREENMITEEQLAAALAHQRDKGGLLGMVLVELGYLPKHVLVRYLEIQTQEFIAAMRAEEDTEPILAGKG